MLRFISCFVAVLAASCASKTWIDDLPCTEPRVVAVCQDVPRACTDASEGLRAQNNDRPAANSLAANKLCEAYKAKCGTCSK